MADQNFRNHARYVFGYHVVALGLIIIGFAWAVRGLIAQPSRDTAISAGLVLGLALAALYGRLFALAAQNRIIRLEEQLRMARVLPDDLKARIGELRMGDYIALRFAPDAELPDLMRRVLGGELAGQKAIKAAIRDWRPDYHRV